MQELVQLTCAFSRSFSKTCASFSMLGGPGGTGRDKVHFPVHGCWDSRDIQIYKQSPTNILNDQIHYKFHTIFDTIKHSSQT